MTATTHEASTTPSRQPLVAALGLAAAASLTAIGTFWDVNNNDSGGADATDWFVVLGIAAVATALVYGLVVRTASKGNPSRRAVVLGVVDLLSLAVFWSGLPMVLAGASIACALADKDRTGTYGVGARAALGLVALTTAGAVALAFVG